MRMAFEYNVWPSMPSLIPQAQPQATTTQPLVSRSSSPPTTGGSSVFSLRNAVHSYTVESVAFGEGKLASTGDNTVVIWNLVDWRPMRTLSGRRGSRYEYLAWDPKQLSNRVASLSPSDRTLKLWDLRAKAEQQTEYQANMDVPSGLAWNPDGATIVLGTSSSLALYDVRQSRILASRKFDHYINDYCYFDGLLAVGTEKGAIEFLDPQSLASRLLLPAHMSETTSLAVNPKDDRHFASGGNDAIVEIWRKEAFNDYVCQSTIDRHVSKINSICFSGNGRWVASSSRGEKSIDVSSSETGVNLVTLPNDDAVRMLAFDKSEEDTSILAYCTERSRDVFIQVIYGTESQPASFSKSG